MVENNYVKQFLNWIKVVHGVITVMLCLGLGVVLYLRPHWTGGSTDVTFERLLLAVNFVAAFLAFSIGSYIYRTRLNVLKNAERIEMKLEGYKSASVLRYALWEGVAIFSLLGYLQTGNVMFTGVAVFFILLLILVRPTPQKIAYELELTLEEKQLLQNL